MAEVAGGVADRSIAWFPNPRQTPLISTIGANIPEHDGNCCTSDPTAARPWGGDSSQVGVVLHVVLHVVLVPGYETMPKLSYGADGHFANFSEGPPAAQRGGGLGECPQHESPPQAKFWKITSF